MGPRLSQLHSASVCQLSREFASQLPSTLASVLPSTKKPPLRPSLLSVGFLQHSPTMAIAQPHHQSATSTNAQPHHQSPLSAVQLFAVLSQSHWQQLKTPLHSSHLPSSLYSNCRPCVLYSSALPIQHSAAKLRLDFLILASFPNHQTPGSSSERLPVEGRQAVEHLAKTRLVVAKPS